MDRRKFLKYAGASVAVVGASALGLNYLLNQPTGAQNPSSTTQSVSQSSFSTTSTLKKYSPTLQPFQNLHANGGLYAGKQNPDEPLIKDLSLALKDPNGKITKYDPDKDGLVKMTDLEAKVDYSLATENVHLPNSLFRHITPSNSNYVRVDNFRLRIDPDYVSENAKNDPQDISNFGGYRLTLKLDNLDAAVPLPLTVGQFTWPFNDSDRDILFYDDISIWYGGQTRDFMGGNVTYQNHAGTDIKRPTGTKTCAGAPGKVIETVTNWPQQVGQKLGSVNNYDAGNYVLIENHSGFWSSCSHLKDVLVKEGDFVKRGQDIGTVDQTGRAPKNSETNFSISIPYKNSPSGRGFPDFYKAWNINNLFNISFWTKDSNKQQPSDPQSPIPDS